MPASATGSIDLPRLRVYIVRRCAVVAALLLFFCHGSAFGQSPKSPAYFDQKIHPLLKQYCFTCHSSEKHKGDFDMERFSSLAEVKRHPKVWQDVAEKLANQEMPPEEKPQPTSQEKERISKWVLAVLDAIGQEHAGDPGPVVLRRLSNAEYTYTVQDLTGIESLQPAREFPIDGAAGEGFMNTGQALVMSPSLITKSRGTMIPSVFPSPHIRAYLRLSANSRYTFSATSKTVLPFATTYGSSKSGFFPGAFV